MNTLNCISSEEEKLLDELYPKLKELLGSIIIYTFTASFYSTGWVARLEYTRGDNYSNGKNLESVILDGDSGGTFTMISVPPRRFIQRGSISILRNWMDDISLNGPGLLESRE
jgi:hypothetical protein